MSSIPRVLSIAGTDPTGGAGLQADLKSIAANGGYGMGVVTALVAQNTQGVRSVHFPPVSFLKEQLEAVSDDVQIDALKIGMLGNLDVIKTVENWLAKNRPPIIVLDPVMVATSGDRLCDQKAQEALCELFSVVDLITPNMPELAVLANTTEGKTWDEVLEQARHVASHYHLNVLAKGGHLAGSQAPDALVSPQGDVIEFEAKRVKTKNTHGTGCSYSSGLATQRAQQPDWVSAIRRTKRWLTESIEAADELDVGKGHGPINHFSGLWSL